MTRGPYCKSTDDDVLASIRSICDARPSYGYRRVTQLLKLQRQAEGLPPVNHKRVYRIMKQNKLLLQRFTGKPKREHKGQVITLKSDLRWCSDTFFIKCWDGHRVEVAFAMDCCDREVMAYVATTAAVDGTMIRDLMAESVEQRFGKGARACPHPIQWLSDNGPPYTANETRAFGKSVGLVVCNTPAYSPESNGMAEAFVKTFKRDYVYVNDLWKKEHVLSQLPLWFTDYNDHHPHKGLKMLSPRQFRRGNNAVA